MARALPLYEQVFDIEYPLPKLDLLIVRLPFMPSPSTY
jgi:aminopeptidase N